jgi:hypothetical protein
LLVNSDGGFEVIVTMCFVLTMFLWYDY